MLTFILAESALEAIPQALWTHPAIKSYSKRHGKHPQFLLLDRSYHHAAMNRLEEVTLRLSSTETPVVIIGGFPHGNFSETTIKLADKVIRIDPEMLNAWTVTSRVIYEYERAICLPTKRSKRVEIG